MFSTEEFKKFGSRVVLFLHNSSMVKGEPYPNLLREMGFNGFPSIAFLDHTGRRLVEQPETGYDTAQLRVMHGRLQGWKKLRAEVAEGADAKGAKLFLMEINFGMVEHEGARARFDRVKKDLSQEQTARVEAALIDIEFRDVAKTIKERDQPSMLAAGKRFVAMIEKGRIPRSRQVITFWQAALAYAESRKDADQFEMIFERAKKEMAGDRRARRYMQMIEARLERLRKTSK